MEYIKTRLAWFRARLVEPSTWVAIGGAVGSAAVIPAPASYIVFACSIAGFILKEQKVG
jgi:hypothetical protein